MAGGPFVAAPGQMNLSDAEPGGKDQSWMRAEAEIRISPPSSTWPPN
jgi:hypothetical protein